MTAYAELQVTSNFSFLRGGAHPEELVRRAAELGLDALALTDRNTLAGVVRAHVAAKELGLRFVVGARLDLASAAPSPTRSASEPVTSSSNAVIPWSPSNPARTSGTSIHQFKPATRVSEPDGIKEDGGSDGRVREDTIRGGENGEGKVGEGKEDLKGGKNGTLQFSPDRTGVATSAKTRSSRFGSMAGLVRRPNRSRDMNYALIPEDDDGASRSMRSWASVSPPPRPAGADSHGHMDQPIGSPYGSRVTERLIEQPQLGAGDNTQAGSVSAVVVGRRSDRDERREPVDAEGSQKDVFEPGTRDDVSSGWTARSSRSEVVPTTDPIAGPGMAATTSPGARPDVAGGSASSMTAFGRAPASRRPMADSASISGPMEFGSPPALARAVNQALTRGGDDGFGWSMRPWDSVPASGGNGPTDSQDRMDRSIGSAYGPGVAEGLTGSSPVGVQRFSISPTSQPERHSNPARSRDVNRVLAPCGDDGVGWSMRPWESVSPPPRLAGPDSHGRMDQPMGSVCGSGVDERLMGRSRVEAGKDSRVGIAGAVRLGSGRDRGGWREAGALESPERAREGAPACHIEDAAPACITEDAAPAGGTGDDDGGVRPASGSDQGSHKRAPEPGASRNDGGARSGPASDRESQRAVLQACGPARAEGSQKRAPEPGASRNDGGVRSGPASDRESRRSVLQACGPARAEESHKRAPLYAANSHGTCERPGSGSDRESYKPAPESTTEPPRALLCFPTDRAAYGRLAQLISRGQRRAAKGKCTLFLDDVLELAQGQILVVVPPEAPDPTFPDFLAHLRRAVAGPVYLAAHHLYRGDDAARIAWLAELADACGTPLVATGDVLYHTPERRPLQDVLTCIRAHCTIDQVGFRLEANAERHLKPAAEMARLFRRWPEALARTREIVEACRFSLDELAYEYPIDPAPDGLTVQEHLERLTWAGARERYPDGIPDKVMALLEHEFELIAGLHYAPYFLTVYDIVRFARARGILCQGRGSAANSAVCYCLGITAVDPGRFDLLFERFVSAERNEPPDIDVDFEHERREEVIQYIYQKYGREHAGIAATVIHYRSRSAIREVGKALGLSEDAVGALASGIWGWSEGGLDERLARERGLDPADRRLRLALDLAQQLVGFPRHLSQHVGGFVLTRSRLDQVVPVVNAAMDERTMVEWDKDDLDALGILKIDVLALGMLTCIRKAFALLERHYGHKLDLASVPPEDPAVYEMLSRADSLGVFQVESRAQMTMLPRLKPRCFYDLIIEVAIVRPGPIQGDMVHPYLRRRNGQEAVSYPSAALKGVLEKTLGVPLFQEQAMQIAIVGAGFTPAESDQLRRAMATFKRVGTINRFGERFIEGMVANGYPRDFAERCFKQIEGFGTYGFPESHAASFALLVYVSSWLKCHYPAVFATALLNSQPMGFYAPAQIVRDARDHGVTVRPVDVNANAWDCTLEAAPEATPSSPTAAAAAPSLSPPGSTETPRSSLSLPGLTRQAMPHAGQHRPSASMGPRVKPEDDSKESEDDRPEHGDDRSEHGKGIGGDGPRQGHESAGATRHFALRLGFRQVKGLKQAEMERLVARRGQGYRDLPELRRRAELSAGALDRLARADAFGSLDRARREALWEAIGLERTGHELDLPPLLAWARDRPSPDAGMPAPAAPTEPMVELPAMTLGQEVAEDYANLRLTLRTHPLALLRGFLGQRVIRAARLADIEDGRRVEVAGLALVRQRPGTASGVIFITIEDESGIANLVVWPGVFERFRRVVLGAQLLVVRGLVQKEGMVIHVVAEDLADRSDLLCRLGEADGPFEAPVARADRIKRPRDRARQRRPSPDTAAAVAPEPSAHVPTPTTEPFQAPLARADEVKRNTRNARELQPPRKLPGFKSRDFH